MAKYPGTLESNNPKEFGIVYATEVAGHKTVQSLEELYSIADAILSKSKTNVDNDALGQEWFVVETNSKYTLIDWNNRNNVNGWKEVTYNKEELKNINLTLYGTDIAINPNKDFALKMNDGTIFIIKDIDWTSYDWNNGGTLPWSDTIEQPCVNFTYFSEFKDQLWNGEYDPKWSEIISLGDISKVGNRIFFYGYYLKGNFPYLNTGNYKLVAVYEYSPGTDWDYLTTKIDFDPNIHRVTAKINSGTEFNFNSTAEPNIYKCSFSEEYSTNEVGNRFKYHLNYEGESLFAGFRASYIKDLRTIEFNTPNVTNTQSLFQRCSFDILPLTNWGNNSYMHGEIRHLPDFSNVTNVANMFQLVNYYGTGTVAFNLFKFDNATDATSMFADSNIAEIQVALPKVTKIQNCFLDSKVKKINITELGTLSESCVNAFLRLNNLESLTVNMTKVENTTNLFNGSYNKVTTLQLKGIKVSLNISNFIAITKESIKYIIDNAQRVTDTQTLTINTNIYNQIPQQWITNFQAKGWNLAHSTSASLNQAYNSLLVNKSDLANKADKLEVTEAIQKVVGAAPEALDTLEEIATKLSSNDDIVAGIINTLSDKATKEEVANNLTTVNNYAVNGYKISTNPVLNKADINLENVDNTADLDKPISTATQAALDIKADIDDLSNVLSEEVIGEPLLEEINTLTREEIKKDLFIDMWNKAAGEYGTYNTETGYFELNGLTDITYEEAVYTYTHSVQGLLSSASREHVFFRTTLRTVLPIKEVIQVQRNWKQAFSAAPKLEVVSFYPGVANVQNGTQMFSECIKLKHILPHLIMENCNASEMFYNCKSLETAKIKSLKNSVSFAQSPLLSLESLRFTVDNRPDYFTSAIIITVHPDVYAKLTDETNAEWHQVLIDAAAKNITFATT